MKMKLSSKKVNRSVLLLVLLCAVTDAYTQTKMNFDLYMKRVEQRNIEFLASKLNVNIADAELKASRVFADPSVDFEGSKETFSLGLSYGLELGKRHARIQFAKSQKEVEKLNLQQGFQELRSQAAEYFLDAILQRELLAVKDSSYQYMLMLSQSDSIRMKAGEVSENDARQSRLEAISLLNEVYEQEAEYHSALVELNRFMGCTADTLFIPSGNWEELDRDFTLPELIQEGIAHRLDLQAAVKNVEASDREYRMTRSERRPDIDLSLSYEREWGYYRPQGKYMTAGVSVPLFFSNINQGEVKAARFRREQASLMQKDMELQVRAEINKAWLAFQAQKKKVMQYRGGVMDESRKVLEGMVFTYKRGEASILDVLVAQRTYNEVCQDYLETMKGYVSSLVDLESACGIWDINF